MTMQNVVGRVLGVTTALLVLSASIPALSTAQAAEGNVLMDVMKVVDGEYVIETITVPASQVAATEERLDDTVGVVDASVAVTYQVQAGYDPYWDLTDPAAVSKVKDVWPTTRGSGQIVAVLDSGVDTTHPDLVGAAVPGTDTVGGTGSNWHGTGVAGIIAARAENNIGSAGMAPESKVMPVRVCNSSGCPSAAISRGILWAVDHGADVINMSLSGSGYSDVTAAAVQYALDKNVTVLAATGNDGLNGNPVMYPAALAGVIGISSTNPAGTPSDWAVNGWQTDLSTVGDSTLLTMPGGAYGSGSGTSFATPAVSGAVALLRSAYPGISNESIQAALQAGSVSSNWNRAYGAGRLDVPEAFAAAARAAHQITVTPSSGSAHVSWAPVVGATSYTVRVDGTPAATVEGTSTTLTGLTNGNQVSIDIQPDNGERSRAVLATIAGNQPATPTLHSAAIRSTSTSTNAVIDLVASVNGTVASRYSIIRDGVSIGSVALALTSTPKTFGIGIGALPTYETTWQLRPIDAYARVGEASNPAVAGAGRPAAPGAVTGLTHRVDGSEILLTWNDMGTAYTYKVSVGSDVVATPKTSGAVVAAPPLNTKRTYQVQAVDVHGQVGPAVSTDVLIASKPVVTVQPAVLGELVATKTVRTPDAFEGATHGVVHNWKACDVQTGTCTNAGTGVTHYITPAEVGKQLVVEAIGRSAAGTTTAISAKSGIVAHPTAKPTSRVQLAIQGQARAGQTVNANSDFDGDYTIVHNWKACDLITGACTRVGGGRTFFISSALAGKQLIVEARGTNPAGTTIETSTKSSVITSNIVKPVLLAAPAVQGQAKAGSIVRTPSTFHNATHGVVHNWKACDLQTGTCTRIGGGSTFALTSAHAGKQIMVEAVAKNGYGTTTVTSAKSGVVTSNIVKPVLLVAPAVQGEAKVGRTVRTPDTFHNATHGVAHIWKACDPATGTCTTLGGGVTLYITSALAGKQLLVQAYGKNGYGTTTAVSTKSATITR